MSRIKSVIAKLLLLLIITSLVLTIGCSNKKETTSPSPTFTNPSTGILPVTGATPKTSVPATSSTSAIAKTAKPESPAASVTGNLIKLKTINYIDQQGTGTEAYSLLIPTNWQYEGGVQWMLEPPNMPAITQFRVWNPQGTEEFSVFPNQALFWTDNMGTLQLFPEGSKYFGNEVKELLKPLEALKQIVIPRFRTNIQGLKIIKEEEIPNVTLPSGTSTESPLRTTTEAGKIKIEYTENGRVYEDEIYCTVEATYYPLESLSGPYTNIFWGVNYIGSFRAEKGKLDASAKIFQTISNSLTLNINWFNTYVQVVEYLIQMEIQQIKSIGQLGSIIAQTGSEIRQENLDLYYQREAMNDRVATQFSEYVRGVDSYYNPQEEKNVELPTGYDNVWVNNLGEYVLSDNPNYNPNVGSNQDFRKLEPAKK
jgi:hypothetical protein